ncbi:AraC family transcriptional regulator [Flavobacterium sp. 1]|uniref:helix-turn-helix domain-containing protein n=1 Tax=Flavobacterium sp. 1 TaxID=2035200 RepID=UPI000C242F74|nr:helix-turn-helix domain-containing protein [Flavobacterium sp. 1]PJJ08613.1 AraC family transcriptional regulator [Flavobacterium sp. 1]
MSKSIHLFKFFKAKYGKELLIDIVAIDEMRRYIHKRPVHQLSYYDLTLITDGEERISLNGKTLLVKKGDLICSIPGDVWKWQENSSLKGFAIVFDEEFLLSFFNDHLFLEKFTYLSRHRSSPFLRLNDNLFQEIIMLLLKIREEIGTYIEKNDHVLRALIYLVLGLLERAQTIILEDEILTATSINRHAERFVELVESNYRTIQNVNYYAERLFITPNYLNKVVRQSLGSSAKAYIMKIVLQEAKNLISYTTMSVEEISRELKFNTSSYFIRMFQKETGTTPRKYRELGK